MLVEARNQLRFQVNGLEFCWTNIGVQCRFFQRQPKKIGLPLCIFFSAGSAFGVRGECAHRAWLGFVCLPISPLPLTKPEWRVLAMTFHPAWLGQPSNWSFLGRSIILQWIYFLILEICVPYVSHMGFGEVACSHVLLPARYTQLFQSLSDT